MAINSAEGTRVADDVTPLQAAGGENKEDNCAADNNKSANNTSVAQSSGALTEGRGSFNTSPVYHHRDKFHVFDQEL